MAKKGIVIIDREKCKACYLCVRACPFQVLEQDPEPNSWGYYPSKAARMEKCVACGGCHLVCPDVCIEVREILPGEGK